jgi:hypothetical protein
MFVGDFDNGNLYRFDLNKNRTHLILKNQSSDRIANRSSELSDAIFGQGFGGITDIKVGPDGYLYILPIKQGGEDCLIVENPCIEYDTSNNFNRGTIYRIVPR